MDAANKRIAKNTIYMYIRLFTTIVIGLYTSRVVLQVLGVSDYGLYSVVGGVLSMFAFISGSLGQATSRFLNTEMGKADGDVNRVFNVNVALHTILAVIVLILAETIGLWYIYNKLTIEPGKLPDALFVYHVVMITSCVGIVNSPYYSIFSAHERFGFLAKLDIFNTLLRLGCVILLSLAPSGGIQLSSSFSLSLLKLYSLIMCLTTANTFVVYHWLAARNWPEIIKLRIIKGWNYYKDTLTFGNWNMLATVSFMARSTGTDLLLNNFFGTAMNGAFAISKAVNQYVTTFSGTFDSASGPQIIQAYSAGDKSRYTYLANKIGKTNLLLFELMFFPLFIELDFILHLWLGEVPEHALVLTQWNLILCGISISIGGANQVINASGKIKWFKINVSTIFLMCIPAGYVLLRAGFPAYTMIVLFTIADILQRTIQLCLLKKIIGFDSLQYAKEAYLRPIVIAAIMSLLIYGYTFIQPDSAMLKLVMIVLTGIVTATLVLLIGFKPSERKNVIATIKNKLLHR